MQNKPITFKKVTTMQNPQIKLLKDDFKTVDGVKLYRIQAAMTFKSQGHVIEKGQLGGYMAESAIFAPNSWVEEGSTLADFTRIHANVYIEKDVIMRHAAYAHLGSRIGQGSTIFGGLGSYVDCGSNVKVEKYVHVSSYTTVEDNVTIQQCTLVPERTFIEAGAEVTPDDF